MSLDLTNTSIAIYRGPLEQAAITSALIEAQTTTALILEVEVATDSLGTHRQMLEGMGFRVSGTVVKATGTHVRFNRRLCDGDSVALSYNPGLVIPKLSPSPEETQAVERSKAMVVVPSNVDELARRIKEKATINITPEPSPNAPEWLERQHADEMAKIQQEIDKIKGGNTTCR